MLIRTRHTVGFVGAAVALSGALVFGLSGTALARPAAVPVGAGQVTPAALVQADRGCHRDFHHGGWWWDRDHHRHWRGDWWDCR